MGYLEAILSFLVGLVKAIPIFDKWFSKTPTQKADAAKEDVRREMDDFRKTGRPS